MFDAFLVPRFVRNIFTLVLIYKYNKGERMAHLVMKVGTWGIDHNAQAWILVWFGVLALGFMVWDFKTTKN